jgi:hypothetical protein
MGTDKNSPQRAKISFRKYFCMADCPRSLGGLSGVQKCSLTCKTRICINVSQNSLPMVRGLSAGRGLFAKSTWTVCI